MGTSHGDFTKYPRTPHLFGSKGTDDDKHLGEAESKAFIADDSLIVEEKIDGTNVGIHFLDSGEMVLQCRGHLITEGMHPQYDLFKQWAAVKRHVLERPLENRFILFGEWVYARHSIHYRKLTHYFFEFDIYDKEQEAFLDLEHRAVVGLADYHFPELPDHFLGFAAWAVSSTVHLDGVRIRTRKQSHLLQLLGKLLPLTFGSFVQMVWTSGMVLGRDRFSFVPSAFVGVPLE